MYSLTSIPTLCYDLVRSPTGAAWGDVLERALRLGPEQLASLEAAGRAAGKDERAAQDRSFAWDVVGGIALRSRRMSAVMPEVRGALDELRPDGTLPGGLGGVLETLTRTPLGGLSDLLAMLRGDVFDWTWETADGIAVQRWPLAVEIVSDALAAAYLGPALRDPESRALSARWSSWLEGSSPLGADLGPVLPGDDALGPSAAALRALVDRAARLDARDLERLQQVCDAARLNGFSWPLDMHAAARAAVESGRVRVAAVVQLAAARGLLLSRASEGSAAGLATALSGALPALTAAVAGLSVTGHLEIETLARLTAPWRVAVG